MAKISTAFWKSKKEEPSGGTLTELYSEVLAQICLAYSITNGGKAMKWDNIAITDRKGDPYLDGKGRAQLKAAWLTPSMVRIIELPRGSSFGPKGQSQFSKTICNYALNNLGSGTNIDAQGRNLAAVCSKYKLNKGGYIIYNDKAIAIKPDLNPYKSFQAAKTGVKDDKWNPADIWVVNGKGQRALRIENRNSKKDLNSVNSFFVNQYKKNNIIPVSLKKPRANAVSMDVVNTNEYYYRLVLGKGSNPTIEFDDGNKDMKINFTLETVQLPPGLTSERASRMVDFPGAKVTSSKDIRLKYTSDGNQLEIEYTQTKSPGSSRGAPLANAKMGKIGTKNMKDIINNTTRQGVSKLKRIQKPYEDKTFINSKGENEKFLPKGDWYKLKQLGGGKPRKNARVDDNNKELHDLFSEYLSEIWSEVSGSSAPMTANLKDRFGNGKDLGTSKEFWSKSRAGEVGLAIEGTSRTLKRRLIQNLYDVAASISYGQGLSLTERIQAIAVGDITRFSRSQKRQVKFVSGPYVKVY